MINLYKNEESIIYVTPDENSDVAIDFYYFKFVHRITKEEIEMWLVNESTTGRFQKFTIEVNDYFVDSNTGLYTYTIQASQNNIVPTSDVLETGLMYLHSEIFEPIKYNEQSNSFKIYNG